jgi:thioredoxin
MNLQELQLKLKTNPHPVVIDFWAPWCTPCRISKPILETLAREYEGRVDFWAINADENQELLRELKIYGIPTVLLTRDGTIVSKQTGSQPRENYRAMFEVLTHPGQTPAMQMSTFDRFLRLLGGTVIAVAGITTGAWFLVATGGVIAFLGIYDRCPIWRAITDAFFKKTP